LTDNQELVLLLDELFKIASRLLGCGETDEQIIVG
jgi:hypothetical protein